MYNSMKHDCVLEESVNENMEFSFNTLGGPIIKGFVMCLPSVKLKIQYVFRNHS